MPAYDIDSESRGESFDPLPPDHWSMPMGSIAGVRLFVSYSVFVALAVLAGLVTMVQNRPGNHDLPTVAMMAVVIWATGWVVQLIVQFCLHFGTRSKLSTLSLGLVGVEALNPLHRRRPWTALANLVSAFATLTALFAFGAVCLVIHMRTESLNLASWSSWADELTTPGLGLDAVKNRYLTATWLFWIQAACQAYPMPRHLGRGAIASAIALFAAEADRQLQVKLLRRFLQVVAIVTLVIAMAILLVDQDALLPRWTILLLLAIYLWVSTHQPDLDDWITSVHVANRDPAAEFLAPGEVPLAMPGPDPAEDAVPGGTPWISNVVDTVRMRQARKRAKAAWLREREEADDAARLDQVLQKLSEHGSEGLSDADRALLERVSQSLRRFRESPQDDGDEPVS